MKITKRKLRRVIKEAVEHWSMIPRENSEASLEITDASVTEEQISDVWPNVAYMGKDVMGLMYNERILNNAMQALSRYADVEFDGQEGYLGYDRRNDVFVMGFDMWIDEDADMNGAFVTITPDGSKITVDEIYSGGGIYSSGYDKIKISRPELVDLRLD